MAELLMFHPDTLAQQFISPNKNDIDKLKALGWVENPKLVAMYHPGTKTHVMVMVQDRKTWENKEYFAEPTIVYHPKEMEPKLVSSEEAKKMLNNGWYSSPAHFPGNSEGKLKTLTLKEAS